MSKPSRLGRLAQLGGLTSRLTGSTIAERVRDVFRDEDAKKQAKERLHLDHAERLVETLGRMRGAAQKLGQTIALTASSLDLPEDVQGVLSRLNSDGEPVPFAKIQATLEREWGGPLRDFVAFVDPQPLGTASLAQAHLAGLPDGREVVIKVLHEGVGEGVDGDLVALKTLLLGGRALRRDKEELDAAFEEVRVRLKEELDYLQEALNIQDFQRVYGDDPRVVIPKVHQALCTERVLVMDRVPGQPLDRFLETASREARQRAGVTLGQIYYEQAFRHRMLHADPHPGNYLFQDDGTVGLLDFGCVKRFDEFFLGTYAQAALCGVAGDREGALQAVRDLGGWNGDDPRAAEALWRFLDTISGPYRGGPYTIGASHDSTMEKLKPVISELIRYPEVRLPPDVIYLHRALGGLYAIARRLEVTHDWGAILVENMSIARDRARGSAL